MRDILFRGKRADNGEWVYSSFIMQDKEHKVLLAEVKLFDGEMWRAVDPETVGEYTGLTDKNGTRIFEGDIIEVDRIYDTPQARPRRFEVEWEESSGFFPLTVYGDNGDYFIDTDRCEVIGNIWDNPELLF